MYFEITRLSSDVRVPANVVAPADRAQRVLRKSHPKHDARGGASMFSRSFRMRHSEAGISAVLNSVVGDHSAANTGIQGELRHRAGTFPK